MTKESKLKNANGMSNKVGSVSFGNNGAPMNGTHKQESRSHPGTEGPRVNGGTNGHANGH